MGIGYGGLDMVKSTGETIVGAAKFVGRAHLQVGLRFKWAFNWAVGNDNTATNEMIAEVDAAQGEVIDQGLAVGKFLGTLLVDTAAIMPKIEVGLLTGDVELLRTALHGSETHRKIFEMAAEVITETINDLQTGSAGQKGYITGRIVFEAASMVFAYTKLGKLAQLKKAAFLEKILSTKLPGKNMRNAFRPLIVALKKTKMCFVAGTLVRTLAGLLPIEQVRAGMYVWSRDEETGQMGWKRVVQTFTTHPSVIHHLTYELRGPPESETGCQPVALRSETLGTTAPHPFFVRNREVPGFVAAAELQIGDELFMANGRQTFVTANVTEHAATGGTFTTYNFEVEDYHTYFVGSSGVWVHNEATGWCAEVLEAFEVIQREMKDLWGAYGQMIHGAVGAGFDAKLVSRWRLRCFNDVRRRFFAGEGGITKAVWNDAQRIGQQAEYGVLNAIKNPDVLGKNMETLLGIPDLRPEFSRHHILPTFTSESKPRMKQLSDQGHAILRKHGIGVNDGANGMYLPNKFAIDADINHSIYGPLHTPAPKGTANIHTEEYLENLVEKLVAADAAGPEAVRNALQRFANGLIPPG